MQKAKSVSQDGIDSYKNAHQFIELSKVFQAIGSKIEDSVKVFDSIGEKTPVFKRLEELFVSGAIEPMLQMHEVSQSEIYKFISYKFFSVITEQKDNINFVHVGFRTERDMLFFLSVKNSETKTLLEDFEFDFYTKSLSSYLNVNFTFLESDMEESLMNTEKLNLANA